MEQCTQRLGLNSAARRLYTSKGMQILHMEQLIEWATEQYVDRQEVIFVTNSKSSLLFLFETFTVDSHTYC